MLKRVHAPHHSPAKPSLPNWFHGDKWFYASWEEEFLFHRFSLSRCDGAIGEIKTRVPFRFVEVNKI